MAGLWGAGDYAFVLARLGLFASWLYNRDRGGCSAQVATYSGFTVASCYLLSLPISAGFPGAMITQFSM